jgi:cyanophycin synthetase
MIASPEALGQDPGLRLSPNFRSWQRDAISRGILPVIAVSGGRGKSTVVRMLDAIFQRAHLRTATWTNLGVEIRGRRQRGELGGWSLALSRLAESTIDVAIQELHWSTINAVGLPEAAYPVSVLTNVLGPHDLHSRSTPLEQNRLACLRMVRAVHQDGLLVINGDDPALADIATESGGVSVVTSLSEESPVIREHLDDGGSGAWQQDAELFLGDQDVHLHLGKVSDFPIALHGAAPNQIANLLAAASTAYAIGVDIPTVVHALQHFQADPEILPGSFNVFEKGSFRAFVDQAGPSPTLRPLLRAVNPGNKRRQITVVGDLSSFPLADVQEIGRLIGRHHGAIIMHSNRDLQTIDQFRRGIAANDYPPVVIHLPTERRALNRALKTARHEDVLLVLNHGDPGMAIRALGRFITAGDTGVDG